MYSDVRIKEDDIGEARDARGGENMFIQEFGGKAWSKEPLGRPGRGWKDSIEMDHKETGWGDGACLSDSGSGQGADTCKHCGERFK